MNLLRRLMLAMATCCGSAAVAAAPPDWEADVVVYGDAAVGVAAAVQSARMGKSTVLVSQYGHLGGMTSSGLGWTDLGVPGILGGISKEFYSRVYQHYMKPDSWVHQDLDAFPISGPGTATFNHTTKVASVFEPKVAEMVLNHLVEETNVQLVNGRLDLKNGAVMEGQRITAISLEDGITIRGKMFIDATY